MRFFVALLNANRGLIRIGVALMLVVFGIFVLVPTDGVREVHNAHRLSNFALVDPHPASDDWPWWGGAERNNVVDAQAISPILSNSLASEQSVELKGMGKSSPIVWRDQMFLLAAEAETDRLTLTALSRDSFRELWKTELHQGCLQFGLEKRLQASTTPVCDGQYVYTTAAINGRLQISSVDWNGNIVWQNSPGAYSSQQGYLSSPVLHQSVVIVTADQKQHGYLAALHRQTGEVVWRIRRPNGESHGTPIVATIAGRPQLIVAGAGYIISYIPSTGEELWRCRWSASHVGNSVGFDSENVYAVTQSPSPEVVCIKGDGLGDVTSTHLVWQQSKVGSDVLSPLFHSGLLYVLSVDGLISCLDAITGKIEWRKRLTGGFSVSPLIIGQSLVCSSDSGRVYVMRVGISSELIKELTVPDGIMAAPIIAGNTLYFRTRRGLHRFEDRTEEPVAAEPKTTRWRF